MSHGLEFHIRESYQTALAALIEYNSNEQHFRRTQEMATAMAKVLTNNKSILVCGNGGSACQAMHFAEELTGRYRSDRKPLAVIPLTDSSHITCVGNDYGFDQIFARSVMAYAKKGDGLLLLSTSGNSKNLVRAMETAKVIGVKTFALLGRGGGELSGICDYEIIVNGATSDCIQNLHMIILHVLVECIERILFPEIYVGNFEPLTSMT